MDKRLHRKLRNLLLDTGPYLFQGAAFFPTGSREEIEVSTFYCDFCRQCATMPVTAHWCRQVVFSGAYQAYWAAEPYYFRCWCGLNSVVLPVATDGQLVGGIELGGFRYAEENYEDPDRFILDNVKARDDRAADVLQQYLQTIATVSTTEVRGAAEFLQEALFSYGINNVEDMHRRRDKYLQQRRIGELMQSYSRHPLSREDVRGMLEPLLGCVRRRDRERLMLLMDDLFCRILLVTGQKLDKVKVQLYAVLAEVMSELVMNDAWPQDRAMHRLHLAYGELENLEHVADVSYWAVQQLLLVTDLAPLEKQKSAPPATKALNWLKTHFAEPVSLEDAADAVGTSIPNLTRLMKKETGRTFAENLWEIRLQEAKHLLVDTEHSVETIALRCGFYDASHFIRRFKADTRLTPREFRRSSIAV